jgi:mono/diheme cytochrome c family protein
MAAGSMPQMLRLALVVALVALVLGCKRSEAATEQSHQLFVNACSRCHGPEGKGGLPLFDGGPSPRNFSDHAFQDARTDDQIKQTIMNGKGTGMPPFGTTFDDTQLAQLVAQIRAFDPGKK